MVDQSDSKSEHDETDMTEMLNELRILLPGAQLLNGFLITLPFNSGFQQIVQVEKWVFMATFLCSLSSLILFTTPAVQHRVLRPLDDREKFKNGASKQMLVGAMFLSLALVLCANLVTAEVVGHPLGGGVAALVSSMILALWWVSNAQEDQYLAARHPIGLSTDRWLHITVFILFRRTKWTV